VNGEALALVVPAEFVNAIAEEVAGRLSELFPAPAEPYLSVDQAAEYLACNRRRIYDLVERDTLPHYRDGKRLLFRRAELDGYVRGDG
jgi:excisionase family DNA binding protein